MIFLLGGWGCSTPPPDRDAYIAALRETDATVASARCDTIRLPSLRGDCRNDAADRLASAGDVAGATEVCERTMDEVWRQECWFILADHAKVTGERALAACAQTGPYGQQCLVHAIDREIPELVRRFPEGRELELLAAIDALVVSYGLQPDPNAPVEPSRRDQMLSLVLGDRFVDQPFDRRRCGPVAEQTCALAYYHSLRTTAADADVRDLCARGPTPENIAAANLPGWTPESDRMARNVWTGLCRDVTTSTLNGAPNPWIRPE